jgi:hypothetical protein
MGDCEAKGGITSSGRRTTSKREAQSGNRGSSHWQSSNALKTAREKRLVFIAGAILGASSAPVQPIS